MENIAKKKKLSKPLRIAILCAIIVVVLILATIIVNSIITSPKNEMENLVTHLVTEECNKLTSGNVKEVEVDLATIEQDGSFYYLKGKYVMEDSFSYQFEGRFYVELEQYDKHEWRVITSNIEVPEKIN